MTRKLRNQKLLTFFNFTNCVKNPTTEILRQNISSSYIIKNLLRAFFSNVHTSHFSYFSHPFNAYFSAKKIMNCNSIFSLESVYFGQYTVTTGFSSKLNHFHAIIIIAVFASCRYRLVTWEPLKFTFRIPASVSPPKEYRNLTFVCNERRTRGGIRTAF